MLHAFLIPRSNTIYFLLSSLCLQAGHSPLINCMWMFSHIDIQHSSEAFSLTNKQRD